MFSWYFKIMKNRKLFVIFFIFSGSFIFSFGNKERNDNLDIISWWSPDRSSSAYSDMADFPSYRVLQQVFNCRIEFNHSRLGEHDEQIRLLVSSGGLPDIITHDFVSNYPGGIRQAVADGIIQPLTPELQKFAPNLMALLNKNPEIKAELSLDDGSIFCFPSLCPHPVTRTYMGPFVRKDILNKTGLPAPETIEEFYRFLKRVKDLKLAEIPLSFYGGKIRDTDIFIGAYGISWGFFLDSDRIRFGEASPEFFDFLMEFSKWVREGLVDPKVSASSLKAYRKRVERKNVAVLVDYVSAIEKIALAKNVDNPSIFFKPLAYPSLLQGQTVEFGHRMPVFIPFLSAYITSQCGNLEKVIRMLDYAYSEKGSLLYNFGIEGESFTFQENNPEYLDVLRNSSNGFSNALASYVSAGAFVKREDAFFDGLAYPVQHEAVKLWGRTGADSHIVPNLFFTEAESKELAAINRRVRTYIDSVLFKFLFNGIDKTAFDKYLLHLEQLGIRRAEKIYTDAYLRLNKK
jgi:putative aldouronate transport system substrate-binding protein